MMGKETSLMTGTIIENRLAAPDHFLVSVRLPEAFPAPLPGQFVMVREAGRTAPLLARPLSVLGFTQNPGHGVLELLYRVVGEGTSLLSRLKPGDGISVMGPLGRGFAPPEGVEQVLFVAGGVGVAPLAYLLHGGLMTSETGRNLRKAFYLGARSAELLTCLDKLRDSCELGICTDDGSRGYCGSVTDLLARDIGGYEPKKTLIYACGPTPMIRSLKALLKGRPIPCQVSLEERMACGLGACLGCAVAIRRRGSGQGIEYKRVCKDGPVFDLEEVIP